MKIQRRQLRLLVKGLLDKHGVFCTIQRIPTLEDEIADGALALLVTKRKPRKKPEVDYFPIAQALSVVCVIDFESNKPKLFAEAKRLMKAKPQPSKPLILSHYGPGCAWYDFDFRGRRGDPPELGQVRLTWAKVVTGWKPQPAQAKPTPMLDQSGLDLPNPLSR